MFSFIGTLFIFCIAIAVLYTYCFIVIPALIVLGLLFYTVGFFM